YTIQAGDQLYMQQYQGTGAHGGAGIWFSDGTVGNWEAYDQDGNYINSDGTQNTWHYRKIDLSVFAGKTIGSLQLIAEETTEPGGWDIYFENVVIVSADGTVHPIYTRGTGVTYHDNSNMVSYGYEISHSAPFTDPNFTTTYYSGDQLGSARMMTSENGYPVWSGDFLPFGQEWNAQATVNHYKFTGQERDAETGLDYFNARHYTSQFGRFLQPDPAGMAAVDPSNPQSWNQYAYVGGNPLNFTDPSGMCANGRTCPPPPPSETDVQTCTETYFDFNGDHGAGVNDNCEDVATMTYWVPGSLDGRSGTPPGGDPKAQQIEDIRSQLVTALIQDPKCVSFLGHYGSDALGMLKSIPITHADIGPPNVQASTHATRTPNPFLNVSPRITINDDG